MPNRARKLEFEMTSSIFCGEWIAWLDAITHRSFIEDSEDQFLDLFAEQANEIEVSEFDLTNITRSALGFLKKNNLEILDIEYFRDGINGGLSVSFVVDLPEDDCYEYYRRMVKVIVSENLNFKYGLMSFDIIPQE